MFRKIVGLTTIAVSGLFLAGTASRMLRISCCGTGMQDHGQAITPSMTAHLWTQRLYSLVKHRSFASDATTELSLLIPTEPSLVP
jgi:hypothetical protein